MFTSIIRITFAQSDGSCQNQHIPTFFDRHIERICLPVGMRIVPTSWAAKGLFHRPLSLNGKSDSAFLSIIPDYKVRTRGRRIRHINRTDRTIAKILLGKKQQIPVFIFYKFVGRHRLAVSNGTKFCIFFSTGFFRVFPSDECRNDGSAP